MTFESIKRKGNWTPIRNCPGRFVLRGVVLTLGISELLGVEAQIQRHASAMARDIVFVYSLNDGGVISYHRESGDWIHTLNTPEGFKRKLSQLAITLQP